MLLGVIYSFIFVIDRIVTSSDDLEFREKFSEIRIGIPESEVLNLLGEPDTQSQGFYLGQKEGYESSYERAADCKAEYFLVWQKEIDLVYSVGISLDKRVVIAEKGGT